MTEIPAGNFAQPWAADTRDPLPLVGDERMTLTSVLDWHRQTFELKCSGVPAERLSEKAIPPSGQGSGVFRTYPVLGSMRWQGGIARVVGHGHAT
jgi:hypothetical protein